MSAVVAHARHGSACPAAFSTPGVQPPVPVRLPRAAQLGRAPDRRGPCAQQRQTAAAGPVRARASPEPFLPGRCLPQRIPRRASGPKGRLLPPLIRDGHKTLIFSQMTQMLDILGDYLALRGVDYFRLDGNIPYAERQEQARPLKDQRKAPTSCMLMRRGDAHAAFSLSADPKVQHAGEPGHGLPAQHACGRPGHQSHRRRHVHHLRQRLGMPWHGQRPAFFFMLSRTDRLHGRKGERGLRH